MHHIHFQHYSANFDVYELPWSPQLHQLHLHHASIIFVAHISLVSVQCQTTLRTWYRHVHLKHVSIIIVTRISLVNTKLARHAISFADYVTHHSPTRRSNHRQWQKSWSFVHLHLPTKSILPTAIMSNSFNNTTPPCEVDLDHSILPHACL